MVKFHIFWIPNRFFNLIIYSFQRRDIDFFLSFVGENFQVAQHDRESQTTNKKISYSVKGIDVLVYSLHTPFQLWI